MKKLLIISVLIISAIGCSHIRTAPEGATTQIRLVAEITDSPFWKSIVQKYVPLQINAHARYQIVCLYDDMPYKLHFRLIRSTGYQSSGYDFISGYPTTNYQTMVEVEATLYNSLNQQVWTWSGWATRKSPQNAMNEVAALLARSMKKDGLLSPEYYKNDL